MTAGVENDLGGRFIRPAKRPPRSFCVALFSLLLGALILAQTGQRPVFRAGAVLVTVDAYPQKDGKIVEGLTADDFEILEDGKPQKVDAFDFVRVEPALTDGARRDPNSVGEANTLAADPRNRVFVAYLDVYHVDYSGSHATRQPLVDGLNRMLAPNDLFGVMTPKMRPRDITFGRKLQSIEDQLTKKHGFPLTAGDLDGIKWALSNFYQYGPSINYNSSLSSNVPPAIVGATGGFGGGRGGNNNVNYAALMMADNGNGQSLSYLASEENFLFLKDLETRNMLVPVVGDFGGDKAIRAVGKYLKSQDATVSAFYLSNVEQYLVQDGKWEQFCGNVGALPLDETSTFIRTGNGGPYTSGPRGGGVGNSSIANIRQEVGLCSK